MTEQLRIATWNLDHASKGSRPIDLQIKQILSMQPDIVILTETCQKVDLSPYGYSSFQSEPNKYKKYYSVIWLGPRISALKKIDTYDSVMAVAVHADTPSGEMLIYDTIITYHGYKGVDGSSPAWAEHYKAIADQGDDWARLQQNAGGNLPLLVAGDFNQTRDGSSNTYGTETGRNLLSDELTRNNLSCITTENFAATGKLKIDPEKGFARSNVDHICLTNNVFNIKAVGVWDHFTEEGKYLSDHNGVYVDIVRG